MNPDILGNPIIVGVAGAMALLTLQTLYHRVVGNGEQDKSIPVQLEEIRVQLASINLKLELMTERALAVKEAHCELKDDFWKHMEKFHEYHGKPGS